MSVALLCGMSGLASGQEVVGAADADTSIVGNVGPFPSQVVDQNPRLAIGASGVQAENSEYVFSRIASVVSLEGGGVVVADGGSGEIRLYAPTGAFQAAMGGIGDGPGEFRRLGWASVCREGQLDAYDPVLGRMTMLSLVDLAVLDTRQLRSGVVGLWPDQVRCLGRGWVGRTRHLQAPPAAPGPVQWPVVVERFDASGDASFLGTLPGDQRYFDGGNIGPTALGSRSVLAARDATIVLGTQSDAELAVYDSSGRLSHRIRWEAPALPITDQDVEFYTNQRLQRVRSEQEGAAVRRRLRDYPFPESYPVFGEVVFDDIGRLWVEASHRLGAPANDWWVFSPSGRIVMTVSFPIGFRPTDIRASSGRVAGVYTDSLAVEVVWVLELPAAP